jgi:flagellar export protein FliJ
MKQFRFPLDTVLRWRETILEQEEAKLQRLFEEQKRIGLAIEQTKADGVAAERAIREQRVMVSTDLRSLAAFRQHLEERRNALIEQKTRQAALIEQQRQVMLEAERRFELLVKLKDRRASEWRYEAGRETEAFAQESFLGRWNVRKRLAANAHMPKLNE